VGQDMPVPAGVLPEEGIFPVRASSAPSVDSLRGAPGACEGEGLGGEGDRVSLPGPANEAACWTLQTAPELQTSRTVPSLAVAGAGLLQEGEWWEVQGPPGPGALCTTPPNGEPLCGVSSRGAGAVQFCWRVLLAPAKRWKSHLRRRVGVRGPEAL
jgi:hypothetical protein